jgi:hypothetical protein
MQFEQWTLAGAANQPLYCRMHDYIRKRISDMLASPVSAASVQLPRHEGQLPASRSRQLSRQLLQGSK